MWNNCRRALLTLDKIIIVTRNKNDHKIKQDYEQICTKIQKALVVTFSGLYNTFNHVSQILYQV